MPWGGQCQHESAGLGSVADDGAITGPFVVGSTRLVIKYIGSSASLSPPGIGESFAGEVSQTKVSPAKSHHLEFHQ